MIRVLAVASEIFPLVKTGGLADVTGALPLALGPAGAETITMVPGFPAVLDALSRAAVVLRLPDLFGGPATVLRGTATSLDLLVVEAPHLYARPGDPYVGPDRQEWPDNALRFAGLGAAAAAMAVGAMAGGMVPELAFDIVHAHDWQAAMAVVYLHFHRGPRPGTVLTVHNLAFQGRYPNGLFPRLGLPESAFALDGLEYHGDISLLKGGMAYADRITTVSPSYAREITGIDNGMGLDGLLRHRGGIVSGILNGIDEDVWNPQTDRLIAGNYSRIQPDGRGINKGALQLRLGLKQDQTRLLVGVISRLTSQKGLDMLVDQIDDLVAGGMQFAVLGSGDPALQQAFVAAAERHVGLVGCVIGYDEALAHLIQAGSDALLVPSRFEPCGLTQLSALRYGAIPVVSRVGGLADSVIDANPAALAAGVATGLQFWPVTAEALEHALRTLLVLWQDKPTWARMQRNAMAAEVSWRALCRGICCPVSLAAGGPVLRLAGPGSPDTLGAVIVGDGIDVAVHAPDADAVAVCLFDARDREIVRIRLPARTGPVHHGHIADVPAGTRYGLRVYGRWDPNNGHRFNPSKLLLDPWAKAVDRPFRLDPLLFDTDGPRPDDTAALVPKAMVVAAPFTPMRDRPGFDWARQVIYELHVRGFSMAHPEIPPPIRGTYAALSHPASIRHLTRLGVTTIELMPSAAWVDERHLPPLDRSNYWGYNPIGFLAPDPRLAPGGWAEVRAAVDALHAAGLNVILDVVLNHSGESDELGPTLSLRGLDNAGYYRLAADRSRYANDAGCGNVLAMDRPHVVRLGMDALRAWAIWGGLDGFRLDLATTLGRRESGFDRDAPFLTAVEQDPVLSRCVMIAEPWDIGSGGYQLGGFPPRWGEWNDRFRDTVRRFWRGDAGMVGALATRFAGSADVFAGRPSSRSINYVTAHDGFTLADLVAYNDKHNQANGEDNRDGSNDNLSWNNGAEGPSSNPAIMAARASDVRALLGTLLLSRGTPMLSMGDELGRTQHGNNNAYAQDNAVSWIDWAAADETLIDTTARLIALRQSLSPLFGGRELTDRPVDGEILPDAAWLTADGRAMDAAEWNEAANRTLIAVIHAADVRAALVFHADTAPIEIALPAARAGHHWWRVTDSAGPAQGVTVAARSVSVFQELAAQASAAAPPDMPWPSTLSPSPTQDSETQGGGTPDGGTPDGAGWADGSNSSDATESTDTAEKPEQVLGAPVMGAASVAVSDAQLDRIAALAGIEPIWWDIAGGYHKASVETKRALLVAMRLPVATPADLYDSHTRLTQRSPLPPVLTVVVGQTVRVGLGRPRPAWVTLLREDGGMQRFHSRDDELILPPQPIGRHRILNEDRPEQLCHLTVAPGACYLPADLLGGKRRFGIAAHLYSLRSAGDQGIGDFTTLARLATEATKAGAAMIGLNPLHALFPHDRGRASPYQPSDRRFLDPIYIDVSGLPGGDGIPSAPGPMDYPSVWQAKRAVLRAAFQPGDSGPICPGLLRFATYQTIVDVLGSSDWPRWPAALRHPADPAVAAFAVQHSESIEFHAFMQRLADHQLATAAASATGGGLGLGLYRDLAVGAAPDGAEAWSAQDTLMQGVSIGAPPDPFAMQGQNWGLPPPDPVAMRLEGYNSFRELLVANMRHAGALRIDHVMGLRRLFVIPDGASGADGAYVSYPLPDLLAQVALESHRARCLVVGEDLGTVPEGMSEALAGANILSYSVLWFVRRDGQIQPSAEWRRLAAACVSTHDLPTLAGWWDGADIAEKRALSLLDDARAEQFRDEEKIALIALLRSEGWLTQAVDPGQPMPAAFAVAVHAFVAATPALLALVQADDLAGETIGVNLPGTDRERPNWRRRLRVDVAELFRTPLARAILQALRSRAGDSSEQAAGFADAVDKPRLNS